MRRITGQFIYPTVLAVAAVLLAFIVLAAATPARAAAPEAGVATAAAPKAERVEARIKELHAKLKITPEQEELWNNVAQAIRENAATMETLIKARRGKAGTLNAVDDLKSYSEIAEAHADGLKKFIPAFEPLYAAMSDAQKKNADTFFRAHHRAKLKGKGK